VAISEPLSYEIRRKIRRIRSKKALAMKIKFDPQDIEMIAQRVAGCPKPVFNRDG